MADDITEVDFYDMDTTTRHGVFVAITAMSRIYADYNDPTMTAEARGGLYPMVLMTFRWDGRIGFVGGFVDKGRSLREQIHVEMAEEANFLVDPDVLVPLIAHRTPRITVHLFHHHLGELSRDELATILAKATAAEHAISEGVMVWAHLAEYGPTRGWPNLRGSNMLATAVAEELDVVRSKLASMNITSI